MILNRIPIVPTLLVLLAVGVMVRLGFWQLDRLRQKEALIQNYESSYAMGDDVPFPRDAASQDEALYNHSAINCLRVKGFSSIAGRNKLGEPGLAITATCETEDKGTALVVLGWSSAPVVPEWNGGLTTGIVAPGPRLVVDAPLKGLQANALPNPRDIPNNHFSYAVQWFLFALTALVIYAIALRKRLAA